MANEYLNIDLGKLPKTFFEYINRNSGADPVRLMLSHAGKINDFNLDFAITQIVCREKFRKKLHNFINNKVAIFPSTLAAEQASHEAIAAYHASLIGEFETGSDLTSGLGIDAMTAAKNGKYFYACEIDPFKATVLRHNAKVFGLDNLTVVEGDSTEWISDGDSHLDVVFIDPARRGENDRRLYNLHDCTPDVCTLLPGIMRRTDRLIIKVSPLLDISATIKDLSNVSAIRAVCVNGECKEVLVEVSNSFPAKQILKEAVNLHEDGSILSSFVFTDNDNTDLPSYIGTVSSLLAGMYLYEPDAALMKMAPWGAITKRYPSLLKLAPSSHLFVSEYFYSNFPGRILKITDIPDKKTLKRLKGTKANVVTRNHPLSAPSLAKQLGVKDGGDLFIYGTRLGVKPILLLSEKIK